MNEARSEPRERNKGHYSVTWKDKDGITYSAEATGLDISRSGVGLNCSVDLRIGSIVYLQSRDGSVEGECEVIHRTRRGDTFHVGFELCEEHTRQFEQTKTEDPEPDYYETLQISCKADIETIHRVFRIMAIRFHPDNSETGNLETFLRMKRAYSVLSDPECRAEYDATREQRRHAGPKHVFTLKDFVVGVEAESNRRLGVLCLLYGQRQTDPDHPTISLLTLEQEMGFPREYLSFTMWYLRAKEFVLAADSGDYAITASGADYVEKKASRSDVLGRLLKPGDRNGRVHHGPSRSSSSHSTEGDRHAVPASRMLPKVN